MRIANVSHITLLPTTLATGNDPLAVVNLFSLSPMRLPPFPIEPNRLPPLQCIGEPRGLIKGDSASF